MQFAIATHAFLLTLTLDEEGRIVDQQMLSHGYHFGIALPNLGTAGNAKAFVAYRGGEEVYQQTTPQLLTYQTGATAPYAVRDLTGEWGDVHQIASANGGAYLTNSAFNLLVYEAAHSETTSRYRFDNRGHDWNHVNSVYPCGADIYVLLHNRARIESELALLGHDLEGGFVLKARRSLWDHGCHNIFLDGKYLIYNASQANQLVVVDLEQDRVIKRISFAGWHSKGLSVTKDCIVVGLSEHTLRDRRATAKSKLAIIDRERFTLLRTVDVDLPARDRPAGNINEIRCLSEPELAHARPQAVVVDWRAVKLARSDRLRHRLSRLKLIGLRPLRKTKYYLRRYL